MEERKEKYEIRLDGSITTGYKPFHFPREMLIESPSIIHKEKNVRFQPFGLYLTTICVLESQGILANELSFKSQCQIYCKAIYALKISITSTDR